MPVNPLPAIMIEPLVRAALLEDLGRAGDGNAEQGRVDGHGVETASEDELLGNGVVEGRHQGRAAGGEVAAEVAVETQIT